MRIDSIAGADAEWAIAPVQTRSVGGGGFSDYLARQVSSLDRLQSEAAVAAQDLAAGKSEDVAGAIEAVERARLSMQLASQLRTKGVEAIQSVMSTPV